MYTHISDPDVQEAVVDGGTSSWAILFRKSPQILLPIIVTCSQHECETNHNVCGLSDATENYSLQIIWMALHQCHAIPYPIWNGLRVVIFGGQNTLGQKVHYGKTLISLFDTFSYLDCITSCKHACGGVFEGLCQTTTILTLTLCISFLDHAVDVSRVCSVYPCG